MTTRYCLMLMLVPGLLTIAGCGVTADENDRTPTHEGSSTPENPLHEAFVPPRGSAANELSEIDFKVSLANLASVLPGQLIDIEPNGAIGRPYPADSTSSKVWRLGRTVSMWAQQKSSEPAGDLPRVEIVLQRVARDLTSYSTENEFQPGSVGALAARMVRALNGLANLRRSYCAIASSGSEIATLESIHEYYSQLLAQIRTHLSDPEFGDYRDLMASVIGASAGGSTRDAQFYLAQSVRIFSALHVRATSEQADLLSHIADQLRESARIYDILKSPNNTHPDLRRIVIEKVNELNRLPPRLARVGLLLPTGWSHVSGGHSAPIAIRRLLDVSARHQRYAVTIFNAGAEGRGDGDEWVAPDEDTRRAAAASPDPTASLRVKKIPMGQPRTYLFYENKNAFTEDIWQALQLRRQTALDLKVYMAGTFKRLFSQGQEIERLTPPHAKEQRRMQVFGNCSIRNSSEYILDALLSVNEGQLANDYQEFTKTNQNAALPKAKADNPETWELIN